jgi:uncharacterized protein YjbI with pentapeptide repeats
MKKEETALEMEIERFYEMYEAGERDFSGMKLHGIDLKGFDLRSADFSGTDLPWLF